MKTQILLIISLFISTMLTAQTAKTVSCTAGNLSASITTEEKDLLTNVTVTGQMNMTDFQTLREMTNLETVDLSNTSIEGNVLPNNAFAFFRQLQTVLLPSTITSIGNSAFDYCTLLSAINIPSSVTVIENNAFRDCYSLTSITIPQSITEIKGFTFYNCRNLKTVTFLSPITNIDWFAFAGCINLSIEIPKSVISIGECAFSSCKNLKSIKLSPIVSFIGTGAFNSCKSPISVDENNPYYSSIDGVLFNKDQTTILQCWSSKQGDYEIPPTVKNINRASFQNCRLLSKITIPSSVSNIEETAFWGCNAIIKFETSNTAYLNINGNIYSKDTSILLYVTQNQTGTFTIPSQVKKISDNAFYNCKKITSIIIPTSVTNIGSSAFHYCTSLSTIEIPSSVTEIGSGIFDFCANLQSVIIPSSIKSIPLSTFRGCKNLTNVQLSPNTTSIEEWAFQGCENLQSITIPSSVTSIGSNAFYGCKKLSSIDIPSSITTIPSNAFAYCTSLNAITIPQSVSTIDRDAFYACSATITVDPQNSNYSSADGVLFNKDKTVLIHVPTSKSGDYTIPASVSKIAADAFSLNHSLSSISVPATTTTIETYAFTNSGGLINVANDNPNYSSTNGILFNKNKTQLIQYPTSIEGSYTMPSSVTSIGTFAFAYCTKATGFTIPATVKVIGRAAFSCSSGLLAVSPDNQYFTSQDSILFNKSKTKLLACPTTKSDSYVIPSSVILFGDFAFGDCNKLTAIYIPKSTPLFIDWSIFSNIDTAACTLYVPIGSKQTYQDDYFGYVFKHIEEYAPEVSITQLADNFAHIYPNPTCLGFWVSTVNMSEISMFTNDGKLIFTKQIETPEYVPTNKLNRGSYLVVIKTKHDIQKQIIIVQ